MRKIQAVRFVIFLFLIQFAANTGLAGSSFAVPLSNTPNFTTQAVSVPGGISLNKSTINGPPVPPPGYDIERAQVSLPSTDKQMGIVTLTVPAYSWFFGCSATSGAMIAGYHDRTGFKDMYTGPANSGVAPLNNDYWPTWSDGNGGSYDQCPLTASRNGLDGRTIRGSINDYWIEYLSSSEDPFVTSGWTEHTWGSAIGDYMKTSQSAYGNPDGSTSFYNYLDASTPLTCSEMAKYGINNYDGTYGRKLFYEARGYKVTQCYAQLTDNKVSGGFSYSQYKAEIDAGRPVMLNLEGHTIVGTGYSDTSGTIYIHDTWDNSTHTMTWGGSYAGLALWGVSIVNLEVETAPSAVTLPTSDITRSSATLNGTVNPNEIATTYYFEWGTTTAYGKTTPVQSAGSSSSGIAVSAGLTGLSYNMTYHYRLVATNGSKTTYGNDVSFDTESFIQPSATTLAATLIDHLSATVNGTVNPKELPTTYYFEWGETTAYGHTTPVRSAGDGSSDIEVSEKITGLYPNHTYHYRLVAINDAGTSQGADRTFKTPFIVITPLIMMLLGN